MFTYFYDFHWDLIILTVIPTLQRIYLFYFVSWEANSSPVSREITHTLRNLKVHYHAHNSPQLVAVLSQINPVYTLPSYIFKIYLPCRIHQVFGVVFFLQVFLPQSCVHFPPRTCHVPRLFHPSSFDQPNNNWWGVHNTKLFITRTQFTSFSSWFLPLRHSISLSTLFANTLRIYSTPNVTYRVSHQNETGTFIFMYIFIIKFLDNKQEDKRFWNDW